MSCLLRCVRGARRERWIVSCTPCPRHVGTAFAPRTPPCSKWLVYQELLPLRDRPGRAVASEVLRATPAVRQLIREGKSHQLLSVIEVSRDAGMRNFADSMARLSE